MLLTCEITTFMTRNYWYTLLERRPWARSRAIRCDQQLILTNWPLHSYTPSFRHLSFRFYLRCHSYPLKFFHSSYSWLIETLLLHHSLNLPTTTLSCTTIQPTETIFATSLSSIPILVDVHTSVASVKLFLKKWIFLFHTFPISVHRNPLRDSVTHVIVLFAWGLTNTPFGPTHSRPHRRFI